MSQYCSNIYYEGLTSTTKFPRNFSLEVYGRPNEKQQKLATSDLKYWSHVSATSYPPSTASGHEGSASSRTHVTSRNKTEQDSAGLG
jgi:hypothetical protein